jgi:hypothetical protein
LNPKKYLKQFRGWLPKEPEAPNSIGIMASQRSLLRFSSLFLPTVGFVLIAFFCYNSLLVFFNVPFNLNVGWLLLAGYIVGIELAIVGLTIQVRLKKEERIFVKKPLFAVGFSFLTVSVLGFIFDRVFGALNVTYPFSLHSLIVKLLIYWRTGWISPVLLCAGFVGWVILLASGALSSKSTTPDSKVRKRRQTGYYLLAVGAIIVFSGVLMEAISLLNVLLYSPLYYSLLYGFYAFANPLGILCLTMGWVTVASARSKKSPILLPVLYAVFISLMMVLFLIPI